MGTRFVLALAVPMACFAPEADPGLVKGILFGLEKGKAKDIADMLRSEAIRPQLEGDPKATAAICFEAAKDASSLAKRDREGAKALGPILIEIATAVADKSGDKADSHWALGHAFLAGGRIERESGTKGLTADPWIKASASYEKAWEVEAGKGEALAEAAEVLAEAAELPGADVAGLHGKAAAICTKAVEKHPGEVAVLKSSALLDLARARGMLAAKDKAGAEAALEKAVALLAPRMKEGSPDIDLGTAHNAIVSFLKTNSKDLKKPKADFVKTAMRLTTPLLVDAPLSRLWSPSKEGDFLFEYTTSFETIRTISFDTYSWDTNYTLADGTKVGGDNLKGLATNEYEVDLRDYKKVKTKKPVAKQRLNGKVDEGWYYEIGGIDNDGDYVLQRSWFFKSKAGHLTTFRVAIFDYIEGSPTGPAVDMVLDSIREVPKR